MKTIDLQYHSAYSEASPTAPEERIFQSADYGGLPRGVWTATLTASQPSRLTVSVSPNIKPGTNSAATGFRPLCLECLVRWPDRANLYSPRAYSRGKSEENSKPQATVWRDIHRLAAICDSTFGVVSENTEDRDPYIQFRVTRKRVASVVRRCIRHLMKKKYALNLPAGAAERGVQSIKISYSKAGTCYAGRDIISINSNFDLFGKPRFVEYSSFAKDPIIGDISVVDDKDMLWLVVAHEVAHFVQFTFADRFPPNRWKPREITKSHGKCWKALYRILRKDLVNPKIRARLPWFVGPAPLRQSPPE